MSGSLDNGVTLPRELREGGSTGADAAFKLSTTDRTSVELKEVHIVAANSRTTVTFTLFAAAGQVVYYISGKLRLTSAGWQDDDGLKPGQWHGLGNNSDPCWADSCLRCRIPDSDA